MVVLTNAQPGPPELGPQTISHLIAEKLLVDQYGWSDTTTVSREGTQLFAKITNQPTSPVFPKSAAIFEWRVVESKVELVKDEQGSVTTARHTQNGATFDAPRVK